MTAGNNYAVASPPSSLALADFDGSNTLDIAVAIIGTEGAPDNRMQILPGMGDGSFLPATTYVVGAVPLSITATHLKQDSFPDLITANFGSTGFGTDISGDGIQDIVLCNANHFMALFLGNGNGTFQQSPNAQGGLGAYVAVADFNRDGRQDLVTTRLSLNTVSVLLGAGDGTFQARAEYTVFATPMQSRYTTSIRIVGWILSRRILRTQRKAVSASCSILVRVLPPSPGRSRGKTSARMPPPRHSPSPSAQRMARRCLPGRQPSVLRAHFI